LIASDSARGRKREGIEEKIREEKIRGDEIRGDKGQISETSRAQ
tara:strand:+ start:352 stop:483 length:132 start_codon:yes stop_codon:yes gene_type:complete